MGMMSETPSSERVQIGFFGIRNAGKSSVVNAVTGQNLSVISDTPGDNHGSGTQGNGNLSHRTGGGHRYARL
jgi:ribosome biogenesis GTPase A